MITYTDSNPTAMSLALVRYGYGWVAPLVHSDGTIRPNLAAWVTTLQNALSGTGIAVGGWGADHNAPTPEEAAQRALNAIGVHSLAFYIANIEKRGEREPDFSGRWLDHYKAVRPLPAAKGIPLGLSTEPRLDLLHHLWINAGADLLPQAYWSENHATPAYCVTSNVAYGWRSSRIASTINVGYGDDPDLPGRQEVAPEKWRVLLEEAERLGSKGASIYGYVDPANPDHWTSLP